MKSKWYLALTMWFIVAPWAISQDVGPVNPGQVESTAQQLTHALLKQGFEVSRGYFKLWGIDDCQYTFDRLGLCFGNNPAAPYITFSVRPWPEEFVDPKLNTIWTESPAGYDDTFRLDPGEAIIVLAQMPPPSRYFSEQTFVFTRKGKYKTDSDTYKEFVSLTSSGILPNFLINVFFRYATPDGLPVPDSSDQRYLAFNSLDNPINNVVMQRQSGVPFDQMRYFIITPDRVMNRAVRDAFAGISVAAEDIFTEHIPSGLNIGLSKDSDDFVTLMRYAQPNDGGDQGTPSYIWRQNLPLVVLRVRHTGHNPEPYVPFALGDLEPRTAFNELPLQSDLLKLVSAVHQRWTGKPCANALCSDVAKSFIDFQRDPIWMVGPRCQPVGEDCLGDNWDAAYEVYGRVSVDNGEVYAIAAPLGTRTGNATYVGLSVNKISQFVGVENLSDKVLNGTAKSYAGTLNDTAHTCPGETSNIADCFFLYYFTRDCSVVENVTGEKNCFEIGTSLIPEGDSIAFGLRDYVRQGTERGPDSQFVLPPMIVRVR